MGIRHRGTALTIIVGAVVSLLVGCQSAQPGSPSANGAKVDPPAETPLTRDIAEKALGKEAEILAQGDLAGSGTEQLLVVNRAGRTSGGDGSGSDRQSSILITRAAILENSNGKWSEVLLCDEHLKNPKGYLGGSSAARESGWRLEYSKHPNQGLEMKFTPAGSGLGEPAGKTVFVKWNAGARRYQSLDSSHEKYLSEAPTLETPESILR
jgi:hypothetical protein